MPYASTRLITTEGSAGVRNKRLSICLKANGFSFAETTAEGVLLTFGEAEGQHRQSMTTAIGEVKTFFAEMNIRPIGYAAMELVMCSDESTWVPDELFTPSLTRQYLKLVGGKGFPVLTASSKAIASTAVFVANEQLATAFKVALPGLNVVNQHVKLSSLSGKSVGKALVAIHWRMGRVDVACFRIGRYLYGNTLHFTGDAEVVYRVVELMKVMKLEGENTEVLMLGEVDRRRYARLAPYFPVVSLYGGEAVHYSNPEFRSLHTYRHALILM